MDRTLNNNDITPAAFAADIIINAFNADIAQLAFEDASRMIAAGAQFDASIEEMMAEYVIHSFRMHCKNGYDNDPAMRDAMAALEFDIDLHYDAIEEIIMAFLLSFKA